MFDTDVFVLGGGPAGLAASIAARSAGFRVLLADADKPPIDKACGEGLMPDCLEAAAKLGIPIPQSAGYTFRGIRFQSAKTHVAADFPNGTGLGVRRIVLQPLLAETAARAGVGLMWRTPVTGIAKGRISIGTEEVRARWIIGADGSQSSVRRWAGLNRFDRNSQRFSYRRHFRIAPWSEYMEIHWGERCQFYVTPVSADEICLALMTRDQHQRVADALPKFPQLHTRLQGIPALSSERGSYAVTRKLRRVTRSNIALIGDASGNVDPITGEGLYLALGQAAALAEALVAENLLLYEAAHRHLCRRPRFMAEFMLLMDRSNFLQRRTMTAFSAHPQLFADILTMHIGQMNPLRFAATMATLVWQVATA
jgi:flavin-dependent dehydrogenase